jgi:hypothetical protein
LQCSGARQNARTNQGIDLWHNSCASCRYGCADSHNLGELRLDSNPHDMAPNSARTVCYPFDTGRISSPGGNARGVRLCNWAITDTERGRDLEKRFVNSPAYPGKQEALQRIMEGFKNEDCDRMLSYIGGLVERVDD